MDGIVTTKPRQVYSQNANRTQFYNPFTTVLGPERLRKEIKWSAVLLVRKRFPFLKELFPLESRESIFHWLFFSAQPKQKHHWVDYLLALYWQSHYMIDHGGFPWRSGKWEILCIFIPNSIVESGEADYCNEISY